ncbi:MAG: hypothetical protein QG587_1669 [Chloroflexota bacterium]|nr:hypothetical protein [Chloroflexota bacterium]
MDQPRGDGASRPEPLGQAEPPDPPGLASVDPLLPPPPPSLALPPPPPPPPGAPIPAVVPPAPVSEAILAIPLGTRDLVRQSLDLLTRRDAGLRGASFYIGFILLVTVTPLVVIAGLALTLPALTDPTLLAEADPDGGSVAWLGWLALAAVPALLGYVAAGVEARALATAVIGGRVEGRPLRLRESIAIARRRFWTVLGAQLVVGLIAAIASALGQVLVVAVFGPVEGLTFGVSLVISVAIGWPFVYVPAGIILGEVGMWEAIRRSMGLVRLRKRLAVAVALFGVLSQFIVLFGLSIGVDMVSRVLVGSGLTEEFPRPLVVPIVAMLVFAAGTLTFLVEAIAAAPAVHAFAALTHYTNGLELGRRDPVMGRHLWNPEMTPGLGLVALLGIAALVGAVLTIPA